MSTSRTGTCTSKHYRTPRYKRSCTPTLTVLQLIGYRKHLHTCDDPLKTMASLSRTTSRESNVSCYEQPPSSNNSSSLPSPIKPDFSNPSLPLPSWSRTPSHSHSLLNITSSATLNSRKSRFADFSGPTGAVGRASISMPPPLSKPPSTTFKPSASRRTSAVVAKLEGSGITATMDEVTEAKVPNDFAVMIDDLERLPADSSYGPTSSDVNLSLHMNLTLPDSIVKSSTSSMTGGDVESNRLSFSSLYSLGSAIYSGATGGSSVQSVASSTAPSVQGQPLKSSLPISPSLGSAKVEASSSATTATDPVSVIANSHSPHSGLLSQFFQLLYTKFFIYYFIIMPNLMQIYGSVCV